jgi:hypothetical protein
MSITYSPGQPLRVAFGTYGGLFWRMHHFAKQGEVHAGHHHTIDHVTLVFRGKVQVEIEGQPTREVSAPSIIPIDKDLCHKFTALEDGTTYFCLFNKSIHEADMPLKDANALLTFFCRDCGGCRDRSLVSHGR